MVKGALPEAPPTAALAIIGGVRPRSLRLLLAFTIWLLPGAGSAEVTSHGAVVRIHSPGEVIVQMPRGSRPTVGDLVIFADGQSGEDVHGYGVIEKVERAGEDATLAVVAIRLHAQNRLIVVGDRARRLNPTAKEKQWEGRTDLILTGDRRYSSRYKRPAYAGLVIGDGHSLERGEFLVDPLFSLQYGVTDRLTVQTVPLGHAIEYYNLGVKVLLFDNDFFVLTARAMAVHLPPESGSYGGARVGGLISLPSNTKFTSHLEGQVTLYAERPDDGSDGGMATADGAETRSDARAVLGTTISSRSEYIFDSWDRLFFGPAYDFDLAAVGGFVGYLMVFDHLHLGLSIHAADFTRFELDVGEGYYPWLTLFWRL